MAIREIKQVLPTMKARLSEDEADDLSIPFRECQVEIKEIKDVNTDFGERIVAVVEDNEGNRFSLFVNQTSLSKMIEKWGNDDEAYIGKQANLTKEKHSKFKNEMIVINPID